MDVKILVIEDDQDIIDAVTLAFKIYWPEAKVLSSNAGLKGVEMTKEQSPDMIILDLGLPDIIGYEVLKRIRLFSSIPILILTVRSEEEDVVKAFDEEANDYIIKPFRQKELVARVRGMVFSYMTNKIKEHL
jgi:DNA-binding response OmpR family regulator